MKPAQGSIERHATIGLAIVSVVLVLILIKVAIGLSPTETAHTPPRIQSLATSRPAIVQLREGDIKLGRKLYRANACNTCHSLDGSILQGPSFVGVFGSQITFQDGQSTTADESYLRESILQPKRHIVAGFASIMPDFSEKLSAQDVEDLIAFIRAAKEPQ